MTSKIKILLDQVGTREEIAAACGVEPIAVYRWSRNGSIPSRHLAGVFRVASRNRTGITAEAIISAHDQAAQTETETTL
ncbi:carph-isopro domain-containing protein [Chachezhania antarctica]|uniref:carph-isopro domain-containing protein n=1 Tax=Chachezhania antarctica TaxID=2340860 RepID=UPI003B84AE65